MTTNLEAAKELYALFNAGDFDGMGARVTDDTEWYVCTGAPYGGYLHGKQEMLTWMKEKLTLAFTRFEPTRYFVDGDEVALYGRQAVVHVRVQPRRPPDRRRFRGFRDWIWTDNQL